MNAFLAFLCFGMCSDETTSQQTIVVRQNQAYVQGFPEFKVALNEYKPVQDTEILKLKCTLQDDYSSKCEKGITFKLKGT